MRKFRSLFTVHKILQCFHVKVLFAPKTYKCEHVDQQFPSVMHDSIITIIPQARVGYEMIDSQRGAELAIIISYPTRASGIIVLLKTPQNIAN